MQGESEEKNIYQHHCEHGRHLEKDQAFCLNCNPEFASSVFLANTGFTVRSVHNLC